MQTSYFGNVRNLSEASIKVSIARGEPKFFDGFSYKKLAPSWDLVKIKDENIYTKRYKKEVLDRLDPFQVYKDLGENAVLLCWEKPGDFCHRRLVAEWLEENLGISVPEFKTEKQKQAEERKKIEESQLKIF